MTRILRSSVTLASGALLGLGLAGCDSDSKGSASAISVTASNRACEVDKTELASGKHTFAVTNKGSDVTEVYVYADGDRVMGEVENVGPGTSRNLTVDLGGGSYEVACKPGMVGDGIRTGITVTGAVKAAPVPDRTADVDAFDYGYRGLDDLRVEPGETVDFRMRNVASDVEHEMEVIDPDGVALGEVGPTKPGKAGSVAISFEKAGTYRIVCGIDDHEQRGMTADLRVAG